jgi:hypothetical protein
VYLAGRFASHIQSLILRLRPFKGFLTPGHQNVRY